MALTKPPVLPAWAEAGDKVQPSNAEIQTGWPLSNTPPARQRWNWLLNFLANGVRYLTRRGMPDYGADETYMIGDRVVGDDGKTYRSIQDNNTGNKPSTSPLWWERWGFSKSELTAELNNHDYKDSCRVATTANLGALSGLLTIDGVVLVAGDRVLVKGQVTASQNGIYVAAAGAWSRAADFDENSEVTSGALVPITEGTVSADTIYMLITDGNITVGVTALTFSAVNGNVGTPGTFNQVTVDAKGRVVAGILGGTLQAGEVAMFTANAIPSGYLKCNGAAISRSSYATLFSALVKSAAVTISIAAPGVVTWNSHGRSANDPVKFTTTGALPTGLTAGTTYYVDGASITTNTFKVSATAGGTAINTSGAQSGVQTAIHAPFGDGDGSTTFTLPDLRGEFLRGWDDSRAVDTARSFGSWQVGTVESHSHSVHTFGGSSGTYASGTLGLYSSTGAYGGSETKPRNVAMLACIKY